METMILLQLQLLGTYQVIRHGERLTGFRTNKIRALLAYLAVESSRAHSRDSLASLFWSEMGDQKARSNLRLSLHRLRQTLGEELPVLQVERQMVHFEPTHVQVDAVEFSRAMAAVQAHPHQRPEVCPSCMDQLAAAASLYQGDFLPGFFFDNDDAFSQWLAVTRERLHYLALQAFFWLTEYHSGLGQVEAAMDFARRQLELEPWREEAHRQLMQLLAFDNQRSAALAQYETCCRLLQDELSVDPAPETEALREQILAGEPAPIPPPAAPTEIVVALPQAATPFVGREQELAVLDQLIAQQKSWLTTIVGVGGMGKTRLALASAQRQAVARPVQFAHGIYFISLTDIDEPDHILPAIAQAIHLPLDQGEPSRPAAQQLGDYLATKQMLLLLDNYEQLLDAPGSTRWLRELHQQAPQVQLLVTSRERLQLQEEQVFPLEGLDCPSANSGDIQTATAVQLFQQSACLRQPDFTLATSDLPYLVEICQLLYGMPLGLELAAAWVELLPLAEIAGEIRQNLDFLASDLRDLPDRHRSMRAVFDASWVRLNRRERLLFRRLALFHDGFTRAAAQAMADEEQNKLVVWRLLSGLAAKSLLRYDRQSDRYTIHELLRQYAAEKLAQAWSGETSEVIDASARHGRYYCQWLAKQMGSLKGERQRATLTAVEADLENIRVAWAWAVNQQQVIALDEAAFSLGTFFLRRGRHQEGLAAFTLAAAALTQIEHHPVRARLLYWRAMFEPAAAARQLLLQSALDCLAKDAEPVGRTGQAAILMELGNVAHEQGQHEIAEAHYGRSLTRYRLAGDRWGEANVLCELGVSAWSQGQYEQAEQRYQQSLTIRRQLGDHGGQAVALEGLAGTALFAGDAARAIVFTRQSLQIYRQLKEPLGTAILQAELGHKSWVLELRGLDLIEDSITLFRDLGTRHHLAHWTVILAMYKADVDISAAAELARTGLASCREIGYQRGVAIAHGVLSRVALVSGDHEQARQMALVYQEMTEELDLPLERSDALIWLSWAHLAAGEPAVAESLVVQVLETANLWRLASLDLVAILLAHRSQEFYERAWRIVGYGQSRFARHRGPVAQKMLSRFLPADMLAMAAEQINALKAVGANLPAELLFARLREIFV